MPLIADEESQSGPTCARSSGPRQSRNGEMQKDMSEECFGVTRAALESFFLESLDDAQQDPRWGLGEGRIAPGAGLGGPAALRRRVRHASSFGKECAMKLNSAQVEQTLSQLGKAIPNSHPAVPQLNNLFGQQNSPRQERT